jgi:hypothetical protein
MQGKTPALQRQGGRKVKRNPLSPSCAPLRDIHDGPDKWWAVRIAGAPTVHGALLQGQGMTILDATFRGAPVRCDRPGRAAPPTQGLPGSRRPACVPGTPRAGATRSPRAGANPRDLRHVLAIAQDPVPCLVEWHRSGDGKALHMPASKLSQHRMLPRCLDPFGKGLQP